MRTPLRLALVLGLLVGLTAGPGLAEEEIATDEELAEELTLYFHGTETVGELDAADLSHMDMTDEEPDGDTPKSVGVLNAIVTPNTQCSGSPLLPTWDGWIDGTVTGDVRVVFHALAHPASTLNVQLFTDAGELACNEGYVPPVLERQVTLEPGMTEVEVVFEDVEIDVRDVFRVMLHAVDASQARILYDAADTPSRVEFSCVPREDQTTCLW